MWKFILLMPLMVGCGSGRLNGSTKSQAIKCWSGGVVIYQGTSVGFVIARTANRWTFIDSKTKLLTEIGADCFMQDAVEQ